MFDRIKRAITGPSIEEMGGESRETRLPPHHTPTIPYKPGTEAAQWGTLREKNGRVHRFFRRFGMEL